MAPWFNSHDAGGRVKTDRRDGLSLARLHRADELTVVWVSNDAQEALRDRQVYRENQGFQPTSLEFR